MSEVIQRRLDLGLRPLILGPVQQTPVSKPARAKIAWSSFENACFAKFGYDLAGPVLKPELLNGPNYCFIKLLSVLGHVFHRVHYNFDLWQHFGGQRTDGIAVFHLNSVGCISPSKVCPGPVERKRIHLVFKNL